MQPPHISQKGPYVVEEKAGKRAWCSCGLSQKQPYCDGAHTGKGYSPIVVSIEETKKIAWCGCKHSKTKPYCDGSHAKL